VSLLDSGKVLKLSAFLRHYSRILLISTAVKPVLTMGAGKTGACGVNEGGYTMYVVAQHTFLDREKALEVGQALFNPPAGITLHYFLPNMDMSKAVCLWEADSLETVKNLVDSTLGSTAKNEFFAVDTTQARGLQAAPTAEQTSVR
jgi:hypothetical protein